MEAPIARERDNRVLSKYESAIVIEDDIFYYFLKYMNEALITIKIIKIWHINEYNFQLNLINLIVIFQG